MSQRPSAKDPAPSRATAPPLAYELRWLGKTRAEAPPPATPVRHTDAFDYPGESRPDGFRNRLILGDNLEVMAGLLPEFAGHVDLVYLDPPFNVGQEFQRPVSLGSDRPPGGTAAGPLRQAAYRDVWSGTEYLDMLYPRLYLARELLSETGSLIVHVDWRVGHLVQVLLDELFGAGEREAAGRPGFRNEIVWGYGGGGHVRNAYRRKHDNLFWYTRGSRWTFNPQYRPYSEGTRQRGLTSVKGPRYALREEGAQLESWWTDSGVQKILSPTAAENLKYPTQKPEALLHRLLRGHSNPGDTVADFCAGSGTTGAVAERLGRRWIMADQSRGAVQLMRKRLAEVQAHRSSSGEPGRAFDVYELPAACPASASAAVSADWMPNGDGSWEIRLTGFNVSLPDGSPADLRDRAKRAPLDFIDYWAVDWRHEGREFRHGWRAYRLPSRRELPLVSAARRDLPLHEAAVQVADVWGQVWVTRPRLPR